jgi:hypothetical protein
VRSHALIFVFESLLLWHPLDGHFNRFECVINGDVKSVLNSAESTEFSSVGSNRQGVLIPVPRAGQASHATYAYALSRSLEQTCKVAALLRSFSAAQPL